METEWLPPTRHTWQLNIGRVSADDGAPALVQTIMAPRAMDATVQQITEVTTKGCVNVRVAVPTWAASAPGVAIRVARCAPDGQGDAPVLRRRWSPHRESVCCSRIAASPF
ncbi:hypothetical protein GCM10010245_90010 [Streptomyces spectabilis]|nr:hypothetical protein GCM10010245_90010 [Streptomyces spectabilis]